MRTDVLIIGGGPAGSAAAAALVSRGWQVILLDKAVFPRNKVCGEFLSPAVWPFFQALGMDQKILGLGGSKVTHARFISQNGKERGLSLPRPAAGYPYGYGLSRIRMDDFLLSEAIARGAQVFENCEAQKIRGAGEGFLVSGFDFSKKDSFSIQAEIVINAAGRFNRWPGNFQFPGRLAVPAHGRWGRWQEPAQPHASGPDRKICFKVHFQAAGLGSEVRIFLFRGGYLGMLEIEGGLVNVCGTVSEKILKENDFDFDKILLSVASEHSQFQDWLKNASRHNAWISCGPQTHQFHGGFKDGIFHLGDAACSLEPFMGQGMTMALAGAFLLAKLLDDTPSTPEGIKRTGKTYQQKLKRLYRSKMFLGNLLNKMTGYFGEKTGWKSWLLFNPWLIDYGIREACKIPISGYQNTWRGGDAPQSPTSTAREQAETLR